MWETFLTSFVWWLEFVLPICFFGPSKAMFCIYIHNYSWIYNALQHFSIFYRTKGNRRITRMRQSIHFSRKRQNFSQAFFDGTYPRVSFQMLMFLMTRFLGLKSLSQSQLLSIRYMYTQLLGHFEGLDTNTVIDSWIHSNNSKKQWTGWSWWKIKTSLNRVKEHCYFFADFFFMHLKVIK